MNLKPINKNRKRDYFRFQRELSIKRKTKILKEVRNFDYSESNYVGKLSKGKIHCSCIMGKFEKNMKIERKKYSFNKKDFEESLLEYQ